MNLQRIANKDDKLQSCMTSFHLLLCSCKNKNEKFSNLVYDTCFRLLPFCKVSVGAKNDMNLIRGM